MEKTSVLAKLKQGDETSFTFVYDHYWRKVYRFSEIYLNDDEEIKEAVQEVFIKLWESRASINENKDIDGLLFIMTRNTIFDYSIFNSRCCFNGRRNRTCSCKSKRINTA